MNAFANIIHWFYVAGGAGVALSYWPQLSLYWREPATRQGISKISWAAWSGGALVTTCYAAAVVHDLPFTVISGMNAAASVAVLLFGLSVQRRLPRPDHLDAGVSISTI
jgi:hypothetical protein